jgi:hypothetical protein
MSALTIVASAIIAEVTVPVSPEETNVPVAAGSVSVPEATAEA